MKRPYGCPLCGHALMRTVPAPGEPPPVCRLRGHHPSRPLVELAGAAADAVRNRRGPCQCDGCQRGRRNGW